MPSPLFVAGLEAHRALEQLVAKLRNVRGRELTSGERYVLSITESRYDELEELLERRAVAEVAK